MMLILPIYSSTFGQMVAPQENPQTETLDAILESTLDNGHSENIPR